VYKVLSELCSEISELFPDKEQQRRKRRAINRSKMQSPLESYTNVDAKREPILEEGENALYTQKRVEFYRDVSKSEGMGTLYVTSKKVTDEMQTDSEEKVAPGYAIDFHSIMMHAIARPGTFR
jgi:hypothetical protein